MTRLPLLSFSRNAGLSRQVLSNNPRRFLSEASPRATPLTPDEEADLDTPEPTTELPVKTKKTRKTKIVEADGKQTIKEPKPKKEKKIPVVRRTVLRRGEVLPEVPAGELPPIDVWRKYFRSEKFASHRCAVRNPETAAMLAEIFVPEGSKDKIIIDASPGPGQLTRALLKLPKERVKKIFVLEPGKAYLKYIKPLEQLDSRVKVYPQHGREWEVYTKLRNDGAFDGVVQTDWDEVHPQLLFIMHMNSWVDGEQLLSQFFRCIPDRQWLFRYGRVPLNLILPTRMWERVNAVEGSIARCKLSVVAQATADLKESVDPQALQPYKDHFHPEVALTERAHNPRGYLEPRKMGNSHLAITALPLKHQNISRGQLDLWDYVLRKLFVLKATSIRNCLDSNGLGPGSSNMLPNLFDPSRGPERTFDAIKGPRDLNIHEWGILVEEFKKWPFRPDDLGIESFIEVNSNIR